MSGVAFSKLGEHGETLAYYHRVAAVLLQMEQQLRAMDLWAKQPPPAEAFASSAPFCIDSMPLEAWLQWVFVPRMAQLIEQGDPLPPACGIAPLAEESLAVERADAAPLLATLAAMDQLLSEPHQT